MPAASPPAGARPRSSAPAHAGPPRSCTTCADGSTVLLIDDDEPVLVQLAASADGFSVMLELTDSAPVDLREPARALLWITGTLRAPEPAAARRIALGVAEAHPHPRLLDLGHGATLVRLEPGSAVLSDAEGSTALTPVELAAAAPDPFCRYETSWLAHLETAHPEILLALRRYLPPSIRDEPGTRVRPLGVDRLGIRLRIEAPGRDHDVRLAWDEEATTLEQLRKALRHLVGCPFRTGSSQEAARHEVG